MYEVSLAFARPASIGARGDPRRQARFGIAGERLWATLDALLGFPRRRPRMSGYESMIEEVRFAEDSPLEEAGFELSVPPERKAALARVRRPSVTRQQA
jgi:hypothetical protein